MTKQEMKMEENYHAKQYRYFLDKLNELSNIDIRLILERIIAFYFNNEYPEYLEEDITNYLRLNGLLYEG